MLYRTIAALRGEKLMSGMLHQLDQFLRIGLSRWIGQSIDVLADVQTASLGFVLSHFGLPLKMKG
jgi:hypothetical protein